MQDIVKEGKVKYIGLSEIAPDNIRRAHKIHPVTAIEMEWSLFSRDAEKDIVPVARELGIGFLAYAPLGRGESMCCMVWMGFSMQRAYDHLPSQAVPHCWKVLRIFFVRLICRPP